MTHTRKVQLSIFDPGSDCVRYDNEFVPVKYVENKNEGGVSDGGDIYTVSCDSFDVDSDWVVAVHNEFGYANYQGRGKNCESPYESSDPELTSDILVRCDISGPPPTHPPYLMISGIVLVCAFAASAVYCCVRKRRMFMVEQGDAYKMLVTDGTDAENPGRKGSLQVPGETNQLADSSGE